jgi:hypothetical protein
MIHWSSTPVFGCIKTESRPLPDPRIVGPHHGRLKYELPLQVVETTPLRPAPNRTTCCVSVAMNPADSIGRSDLMVNARAAWLTGSFAIFLSIVR